MRLTKKEKEEISKRIDIAISTFYNWEKTKPELLKLVILGLEYEKIKSENKINEISHEKTIEIILKKLEDLEKKINKN